MSLLGWLYAGLCLTPALIVTAILAVPRGRIDVDRMWPDRDEPAEPLKEANP